MQIVSRELEGLKMNVCGLCEAALGQGFIERYRTVTFIPFISFTDLHVHDCIGF